MNKIIRDIVVMGKSKSPVSFADAFARSDGAVGNGWVGGTWTVATGKLVNTPAVGDEISTDGSLENWISATNLTSWSEVIAGTSTVNQEATIVKDGSSAARLDIDASNSEAYFYQSPAIGNDGRFAQIDFWAAASAAAKSVEMYSTQRAPGFAPGGETFVNYKSSIFITGNRRIAARKYVAASSSLYVDKISVTLQTTSELSVTRPVYPTSDYILSVNVASLESGTKAGIIFSLDNPANPQNYFVLSLDGATIILWKCVAGVFSPVTTNLNPLPPTFYSANDKLTVVKNGTSVRVFLNDVLYGSTITITDDGLKDNRYAGVYSTYLGNTFDNWSETVRVAGGSNSFLLPFFNPGGYIFPIGDSVTGGSTDGLPEAPHGYPPILINLLEVSEHGNWEELPARLSGGGWTVAYVKSVIDAELATRSDVPRFVLIYLGANDISSFETAQEMINEFDYDLYKLNVAYILDALRTKWADTKIYWGVDFWTDREPAITILEGLNAEVIAGRSNCFVGVDGNFMSGHPEWLADVVHPNYDGFVALAGQWKATIGL